MINAGQLIVNERFFQAEIDSGFYTDHEWDQLIQSLNRSKGLEELEIIRQEYGIRLEEELEELFQAISNIPRIGKLSLVYFSASNLSSVNGTFGNFRGVEELWIDLATNSSGMSDEVTQSIASIPQLRRISITTHSSFAISNLFSPHVESIFVDATSDVPFKDDHFRLLMEDLKTNRFTRLKNLKLPWLTVQDCQIPLLASMLEENMTLEKLCLSLSIPAKNVNECCEEILEAMSHNNILRHVRNLYSEKFGKHVSSATKERQNQMLSHNTTVEKFDLFQDKQSSHTSRQKNLLLRLNKAGRKRLMGVGASGGSAKDWIDVISHEDVRNDLPCLFHLLRMNPSLCLSCCQESNGRKRDRSGMT